MIESRIPPPGRIGPPGLHASGRDLAARRTVLSKLRELARLLDDLERADGGSASARAMRRLEELIDLLWQTDEIRVARLEVLDEARNAVYYFDEFAAGPIPDVLEELAGQLRSSCAGRRRRESVEVTVSPRRAWGATISPGDLSWLLGSTPPSHEYDTSLPRSGNLSHNVAY